MPNRDQLVREFTKRRFILAVFFSGTSSLALFTGHMSGGEYVAAMTAILGLYGIAAWKELD